MESQKPLTEDVVLYFLYLQAKERNSKVFFKVKHNLSLKKEMVSIENKKVFTKRGWFFYFAPDVDMLEITPEKEIIGYEAKGQRKGRTGYDWPSLYEGLDEALFYLQLPYVQGKEFEGGVLNKVFVAHAHPNPDKIIKDEKLGMKVYELATPIGLLCITPKGEIIKLVEAKNNPLLDESAKDFLLKNLNTLENFSENSRTFRQIREKGGDFQPIK